MTTLLTRLAALALATSMALTLGCEHQGDGLSAEPTSQPSSAAPTAPNPDPIPARALLGLDELEPTIDPPKGRPEDQPLPENIRNSVAEARDLIVQRNFATALAQLERAAGFAPNNAQVRRLLGQAYAALPNRGKAEANLTAAVKTAGDDLRTQLLLGQLAAARQDQENAIRHVRTAMLCSQASPENPNAAEAILTLALLLDQTGYWSAALEAYRKFADWAGKHGRDYVERKSLRQWILRPEKLLSRQGALLLLLRRRAEGIALLDRAYRRDRTNAQTAGLLVDALLGEKQFTRVEKMLLDMINLPAQRRNLPNMLIALCRESKDRRLPERFWSAVAKRNKQDSDVAVALARTARQLGWKEEATAILLSVATSRPNNAGIWRMLGRDLSRQGRYDELVKVMDRALSADPASVDAMAESMPDIAAAAEKPGVERDIAELARKTESKNQYALFHLAGLFATAKDKNLLAATLYQRATEKNPDFFRAYESLVEAYLAQKRDDRVDRLLGRMSSMVKDPYLPHYLRGKVELKRGRPGKAVTALEQARRHKADNLQILLLLADAYAASNRLRNAVGLMQEALIRNPSSRKIARKLFDIYIANRQFREATDLAKHLQRKEPNNFHTKLMLAESALLGGKRKEAIALLGQLASVAPENADVQVLAVRAMLGPDPGIVWKKDFDTTARRLRQIVRLQPGNRKARKALAELLLAVGQTEAGASFLGSLFEETPGDTELARMYVDALEDPNQALEAVETYRAAKDRQEDLWGRIQQIRLLGKLRRFDAARELAETWIKNTPEDNVLTLYRRQLLEVMQDANQHDAALEIMDAWLASDIGESMRQGLQSVQVGLLGMAGQYEKGMALVRKLSKDEPLDYSGRNLAQAAMSRKDYDKSLDLLAWNIESIETFACDLADLRKAVKALSAAKATSSATYVKALKKMPPTVVSKVTDMVSTAKFDKTLVDIDTWASITNKFIWETHAVELFVLSQAERTPLALELARKWVTDSPKLLTPRQLLIETLILAKKLNQADKLLDKWRAEKVFSLPTGAPTHETQAAIEARKWLREMSVRLKIHALGVKKTLKFVDEMIEVDPKNAELLTLKSTILGELGRSDEAVAVMDAALALEPTDASFNNNMGYLLAVRGERLDEAEKMLRVALATRPQETSFTDSLGWVFYKQGRLRMAGLVFQRVIAHRDANDPSHGVIFDHAGDTYWRLGWHDKAVELWTKALELGRQVEEPMSEDREMLKNTPGKIKAVGKGLEPKVSPLGEKTMPDEYNDDEAFPVSPAYNGSGW